MRRATARRRRRTRTRRIWSTPRGGTDSTDADIFAVIKDGIGPKFDMKGYNSKMTPQEMWSIVNYLRSIGPKGAPR